MKTKFMLAIAATILLSLPVAAQNAGLQNAGSEAKTAIDAAVAAMGTAGLQSIQYSGTGSFFADGPGVRARRAVAAIHGHEIHDGW